MLYFLQLILKLVALWYTLHYFYFECNNFYYQTNRMGDSINTTCFREKIEILTIFTFQDAEFKKSSF